MNEKIEAIIQSIGSTVLDIAVSDPEKIMVYAEVEDGVSSVSVFIQEDRQSDVSFRFGGSILSELFYSLWQHWPRASGQEAWRASRYSVVNGKASLSLVYPEQFDESQSKLVRRSQNVQEFFGTAKVDYSNQK